MSIESEPSGEAVTQKCEPGHSFTHLDHPVLVMDLHGKLGRTFCVTPAALSGIVNNLSIANMGFDEFAEAFDQDGIFVASHGLEGCLASPRRSQVAPLQTARLTSNVR